ncbi:Cell wall protein PGA59 [Candida tropicalis]
MKFSTAAIFIAVAGSAFAGYANSTVTEVGTTIITVTSCEENKCTEVPVTTGVVTVTEIDTTYTTYCPLTSEEESTKAPESTSANSTAPSVSTAEAGAAANAAPVVAAGLLALGAFM